MKATIEFDDALYRRLKIEAAKRGRTVRELVAEGVRRVLNSPASDDDAATSSESNSPQWQPTWFASLAAYGDAVPDHSMHAVRASIAAARRSQRNP
jgi:hypothetical protein